MENSTKIDFGGTHILGNLHMAVKMGYTPQITIIFNMDSGD